MTTPQIRVATLTVPANVILHGHEHDEIHLCGVLTGMMSESGLPGHHVLETGTVRLSAPVRRDLRFGPVGARCVVASIPATDVESAMRSCQVTRTCSQDAHLIALARRLDRLQRMGCADGSIDETVVEMLARFRVAHGGSRPAVAPDWLRRTRDWLADEWQRPPSAAVLAAAAGVHRVHLVRAFHDHFGCSPGGFVRRRRLACARHLVLTSRVPLSQIAAIAGFADQAHMTRTFRRLLGATPAQCRNYAAPASTGNHAPSDDQRARATSHAARVSSDAVEIAGSH